MPARALEIVTLGALIDRGYSLWLHCEAPARPDGTACHFGRPIDLPKLAAHLGRDHSWLAPDLKPHLFCPQCRSTQVGVRLHPSTGYDRWK